MPNTTPRIVFDASSVVGALLGTGSVPEVALLLARSRAVICLSAAVAAELREVLARPKFAHRVSAERVERILQVLMAGAEWAEPAEAVADCRDRKDNRYLELALSAGADVIVSSDADLLVLDPWRGIRILTPAAFLAWLPAGA